MVPKLNMEVHNRDVFPTQQVRDIYPLLAPVIANPLIDKPFAFHEEGANSAKRYFHRWGRLALVLVLTSTLFTVAERLVIPPFPSLRIVSVGFVILGIWGLAIQINLLLRKQKQIWLCHRFAAERLRSIKFQAYQFATTCMSIHDLQKTADAFYTKEVARLTDELNAGYSALLNFSPSKSIADHWTPGPTQASNHEIAMSARDAYRDLRASYQRRFAESEILALQQKQRVNLTAADILYLSGATLAIAALTGKSVFPYVRIPRHENYHSELMKIIVPR